MWSLRALLVSTWKRVFRFLLCSEWFRKYIIFRKLGITVDESIQKTPERPLLHAAVTAKDRTYHMPVFANQHRIDTLQPLRPSDVVVLTYPKSGTHLCSYIVKLLAQSRQNIMADPMVLPFLEMLPQAKIDAVPTDVVRYFKSHLPYDLLPVTPQNKVVFCVRDPLDVCLSYYKFTKTLDVLTGPVHLTFDEWFEDFLAGYACYGDWFDFVLSYWQSHRPNILLISYEGILADPEKTITRIAEFLGFTTTTTEVADIKEKIQFNNMKKELVAKGTETAASIMRKGHRGEGRECLTPRQKRLFFERYKNRMAGTGFDLYTY